MIALDHARRFLSHRRRRSSASSLVTDHRLPITDYRSPITIPRWPTRSLALLLCAALTVGHVMAASAGPDGQAAKIKAAFVYNFLKYTEWPRPSADATNAPFFVFAVVGQNGLEAALKSVLEGKTVAGRPIRVRTFADAAALAADPTPGDALYVEASAQSEWETVRKALGDRPVLTVAEMRGFCASGGMLNLYEQENRVRFEANPAAVKACGLKLSAELLKLATIVNKEVAP